MRNPVAALIARLRRPRGRIVECAACGEPLPVAKAVVIHGDIDHVPGYGLATTVAEYHRRCAPDTPA